MIIQPKSIAVVRQEYVIGFGYEEKSYRTAGYRVIDTVGKSDAISAEVKTRRWIWHEQESKYGVDVI